MCSLSRCVLNTVYLLGRGGSILDWRSLASRSSISRSLVAVSTGLAPPKILAAEGLAGRAGATPPSSPSRGALEPPNQNSKPEI